MTKESIFIENMVDSEQYIWIGNIEAHGINNIRKFHKAVRMKCLQFLTLFHLYFDAIDLLIYTYLTAQ